MAYQVIARKWRPLLFEDVIGQTHITKTLQNAIQAKRIGHAYIFSGPRGVGKTTTARIFAKALNCEKGPAINPCNQCKNCLEITQGINLDVLEIDGASNNSVEDIRNLKDNIRFTPASGRYKVYIIDEVHMLSTSAFNALLKTLEEPPQHAIFIFATTEIHKVVPTILSRCQRHDFKSNTVKEITGRLGYICSEDKIEIEAGALLEIAKKADGAMRDAQSLLDQVISFSGNQISFEDVRKALGIIDRDLLFKISLLIAENKKAEIVRFVKSISESGIDISEFISGLEEHFRNVLVTIIIGNSKDLEVSQAYKDQYDKLAVQFDQDTLLPSIQIIQDVQYQLKRSFHQKLKLELLLLKLTELPGNVSVELLLEEFRSKKKRVSTDPGLILDVPNPESDSENAVVGVEEKPNSLSEGKITEKNDNSHQADTVDELPDLLVIRKSWAECIKDLLDNRKTLLANQMSSCLPVLIEKNGIIKIGYDAENKFAADHVRNNVNQILPFLQPHFKNRIRIEFTEYQFKPEEKPRSVSPDNIRLEDIVSAEPVVKELMETFDLKLMRIIQKAKEDNI